MTVDEIIKTLLDEIQASSNSDDLTLFKECPFDQLTRYHHSLGTDIRNRFNLWEIPWEPEIKDGIDYSPYHPDQVSMTIIEELWRRLQ